MGIGRYVRERWWMIVLVGILVVGIILWRIWQHHLESRDGDEWLARGTEEARDWRSDAQLVRFDGDTISPDATMPTPRWVFVFASASMIAAPRPASVPGARPPRRPDACFVYSVVMQSGARGGDAVYAHGEPTNCPSNQEPIAKPLRCSIKQVWARAKAAGAPTPAYAKILLESKHGVRTWHFEIPDYESSKPVFRTDLDDDC